MRAATSAVLGALAAIAGWAAWSSLAPAREPAHMVPAVAGIAANTLFAPDRPSPPAAAPRATEARVGKPAAAAPAPTAALREGQVMEHGMPTALHAGSAVSATTTPPVVALPLGARPEDAVVNAAGLVTLTRSAAPATGDAATPAPVRPVLASRAP